MKLEQLNGSLHLLRVIVLAAGNGYASVDVLRRLLDSVFFG
jgi:hypothetical protein